MRISCPDYLRPGSLELRKRESNEFIGQPIDYSEAKAAMIRSITLHSLELARIDLIKIDIEGMEIEAIEGAAGRWREAIRS
jgi:FkbM family methyltransferase